MCCKLKSNEHFLKFSLFVAWNSLEFRQTYFVAVYSRPYHFKVRCVRCVNCTRRFRTFHVLELYSLFERKLRLESRDFPASYNRRAHWRVNPINCSRRAVGVFKLTTTRRVVRYLLPPASPAHSESASFTRVFRIESRVETGLSTFRSRIR